MTGDFCAAVTPDLLAQLKINKLDTPAEKIGKLRLFGRYQCLCKNDCPKEA